MKSTVTEPDLTDVYFLDANSARGHLREVARLLKQFEKLTGIPMQVIPIKQSTPKKDDAK